MSTPTHVETVTARNLQRRLTDLRAQFQGKYSTAVRMVYWAPAQRMWITIEQDPRIVGQFTLALYTTCPCALGDKV